MLSDKTRSFEDKIQYARRGRHTSGENQMIAQSTQPALSILHSGLSPTPSGSGSSQTSLRYQRKKYASKNKKTIGLRFEVWGEMDPGTILSMLEFYAVTDPELGAKYLQYLNKTSSNA